MRLFFFQGHSAPSVVRRGRARRRKVAPSRGDGLA
jgi:hypothetical protein